MSELDVSLLRWINGHRHPMADAILGPVALSGEIGLLMGLFLLCVFGVGTRQEWRRTLLLGLLFLALDRLMVRGLQTLLFRVRPYLALSGIHQGGIRWHTSSFPSGHAHTAWTVTIVLGLRWPRTLWF